MNIVVEQLSPDQLTREAWRFLVASITDIRLDNYVNQTRKSKRHHWGTDECVYHANYNRLTTRNGTTTPRAAVPLPNSVEQDLLKQTTNLLLEAVTKVHLT